MDDTVSLYGSVQVSKNNRIGRITETGRPEFASLMSAAVCSDGSTDRCQIAGRFSREPVGVGRRWPDRTDAAAGPYRVSTWRLPYRHFRRGVGM
jgi:hypothetical protein